MSFLAAIFISCSRVSLITMSVLQNQPPEDDPPVSQCQHFVSLSIVWIGATACTESVQLDRTNWILQQWRSFEPSRDFRMARAIDKITCTQTVQTDAMRQHTLHNTELLRNARGQTYSPFADKSNAKVRSSTISEKAFFFNLAGFARLSLC